MASPFRMWSSLGPFFINSGGVINGEDWELSNAADGGTPIWVDTYTPASGYVSGSAGTYTIAYATQDWLGDIQTTTTLVTYANFVDPFLTAYGFNRANLATPVTFSSTSTQSTGGLAYWAPSSTAGDYAVKFQPMTMTIPTSPQTTSLATLSGSPTTMISAIAKPLGWTLSTHTSNSMVFAYTTAAANSTENLYFEAFNAAGVATSAGPVLIANLPVSTPYYIAYNSSGYGYRYLEVGGTLGTGLVGGSFSITSDDALGSPSLILALPSFTSFYGLSSFAESDGASLRLVEGVASGKDVLQSFLNSSSTAKATFALTAADDHFGTADVYDPSTEAYDYVVVAYTDNNAVHLELLDDNGVQIGSDLVVPGITSFDRIHTLDSSTASHTTRVELDYTVTDPNGGTEILGYIYDTASAAVTTTLTGGGLRAGTPFNDTFEWGAGVYTIDGGGGDDSLVDSSLSAAQATIKIDAAGEAVLSDGSGDVDTLRRIGTIDLSNATVTISGRTLTQLNSDDSKVVTVFDAAGSALSIKSYNAGGTLVGLTYPSQIPSDFTGDGRSDIAFQTQTGASSSSGALATWQMNGASITGGGTIGNPGAAWTYQGSGDFYGNGDSDALWRNQNGTLDIWEVSGTSIVGGGAIGNPGAGLSVVAIGDVNADGDSDILFGDASGDLSVWEMSGTTLVASGAIGNPGKGWTFLGLGDFNGDGASDALFENASGQYATWLLNGGAIVGGATLGSPGAGWVFKGIGNFNGLGDGDILFENTTTGAYATWDVSNDAISGGGTLGTPGSSYAFAAIGDYTTNGKSDILFRNVLTGEYASWNLSDTSIVGGGNIGNPGSNYAIARGAPAALPEPAPTIAFVNASGTVATWEITDGAITGGGTLGSPGAGWTALAAGDFYGDGQSDILFENTNGTYATWRTNGASITGGGSVGSASGYTFKGLGDFNGDGISDLLFENASGNYATWEMNGTSIIGGGSLGSPGTGFTYAGTGDFTGDGSSDVLLTDSSGNYWVWFVNNGSTYASAEIGNPGSGWSLKGIGDLNGDGKADLLFQNTSGIYASWDLNNASIVGGGTIGNPGSQWTFAGIADLNAPGHASIVFDDAANGQVATWLMNDTTIAGGGNLGSASGFSVLASR